MQRDNDIIRMYLKRKKFNRVSPLNGFERYELNGIELCIDFHTGEYIATHLTKEKLQGKYEDAFTFILEIDKYRLL